MKTSAARNQESVQASMSELRRLHVARVDAEREAAVQKRIEAEMHQAEVERLRRRQEQEAERLRIEQAQQAEERRLAAEREHELAREKARLDAEARVEERRLELDIKQAEVELARAQAMTPARSRPWPLLAAIAVLLGLQGALYWELSATQERLERVVADTRAHGRAADATLAELEDAVRAAADTARHAQSHADELAARLDAPGKPDPRTARPRPPRPSNASGTPKVPKASPARPGPLPDLGACAREPLGCMD